MIELIDVRALSTDQTEAFQTLLQRVGRKSQKIPAELLVRQVLRCVPPQEWPVRVEAMDALLRRLESAKNDKLRIESKPAGGRLLGPYRTGSGRKGARPYETVIRSVDPIEGRCNCPDYLKNSLGVCKHILVVLEHLYSRPRLLKMALSQQKRADGSNDGTLTWDPIRPLTGAGDWLERVTLSSETLSNGKHLERLAPELRSFLVRGNSSARKAFRDDAKRRLTLVEGLLKVLGADSGRDPALHALLVRERDRLKWTLKRAVASTEIKAAIKGLKRPLYPYQKHGVERFLTSGRLLLADDMGLGKTAQAIACCAILWHTKRIRRGLIIAPASLKPQWSREWASFSDLPIQVVDGGPAERADQYRTKKTGFLIINYEQLLRDLETIQNWEPDLIILDEAQRIKNWATKTALSVKRLAPAYRLVLTGTPMENRIDELASVVEWVDDMALEPKWRLNALHSVYADGKREVKGVRHLDTLRERLSTSMVRRVRQEVLDQLPPRTDTRVPVEMTDSQKEEHDALIQPIAQLVQKSKARPLTQAEFLRLMSLLTTQRIISNGLAQLRFEEVWPALRSCAPEESVIQGLSAPKLLELRQLGRQIVLEQGRKVVVFSQWRRMLSLAHWAVSDMLSENGLRAGFFTGAEGQRRRTQNIVEFHDDPDFRLLFASDAGGVGLNLQHASNCVINLELPWNPAVLEQRIGRVYRLGQTKPIDVYNLVCEEGIESRIAGLVGAKHAFFKGLFDGETNTIQFEQSGSFMSRVEKIYELPELGVTPGGGAESERVESSDAVLDDDVTDLFEEILESADESDDVSQQAVEVQSDTSNALSSVAVPSQTETSHVEVDGKTSESPGRNIHHLFSQLKVRKEPDGRLVIEAPAEAASTLSALFEGMAALLLSATEKTTDPNESN